MQSLFFFLVALALLIVIHEYGHFWVARRCGVKVLRFSVGFGKPLWRYVDKAGTEFVLAPFPLGGYVKMLDEREGDVDEQDKDRAFNRQSLAKRSAIVAAGPAANLLFAILAYWLLLVTGIPGIKPLIEQVETDSIAWQSGLLPGDEITRVDDRETPTWNSVFKALLLHAEQGSTANVNVLSGGTEKSVHLSVPQLELSKAGQLLTELGLTPLRPEIAPVLGQIIDDSPASKAGLKAGDTLIAANGESLNSWNQWVDLIQDKAGQVLTITVERQGQYVELQLTPEAGDDGQGRIGAAVDVENSELPAELQAELQFGPLAALQEAVIQTWLFTSSTLKSLWGMLTGNVSTENLGGPISIAQIAGSSAEQGFISFVSFLAMISITLGILNLLPIPMLDGGHLVLFLMEAIRGKPIPEEVQIRGQQIGLFLLLMLMFLAFFNDLSRLFG
jgi:regulator of sigma E protease